jgi:aminomethyltransferase
MALRTSLYDVHVRSGARIVEFAGWDMPVQYTGVIEEHRAVRERAGIFDVSHMGEVEIRGKRALEATQKLVSNDVGKTADGQAVYAGLLNDRGGFVDDVVAYRFGSERILICVNAANRGKDFEWMKSHAIPGVDVVARHDDFAQLAIQGPKAAAIVQRLTRTDLATIQGYHFTEGEVAGVRCIIARTGYTGEDGFELFCDPASAPKLWGAILEAGRADGILPCGLGARDTLRTEARFALYGNDIDDDHTPLEAGLSWVVKFDKGDFVGKAALEKQKAEGVKRKLSGFTLTERGVPRHGYAAIKGGTRVGEVTSGTMSPTLGIPIGLAYLPTDLAKEGSTFDVEIRGKPAGARVVKTPFYKRPDKK